jgi:hypothetical protein
VTADHIFELRCEPGIQRSQFVKAHKLYLDILFNHLMSEMMMAMMKLTMIIDPRMIKPISKNVVSEHEKLKLELSELLHRSSNSNSPKTMTKHFSKNLPTRSKDSFSLPKWMMKKAKAQTRQPQSSLDNPLSDGVEHDAVAATCKRRCFIPNICIS